MTAKGAGLSEFARIAIIEEFRAQNILRIPPKLSLRDNQPILAR